MRSGTSTTELLRAVVDGDSTAWNELVDRYARLVWSVCRSFRLDDAAAADVSQTVWLRLTEHCHRIDDPEKLGSWLATTTRNEALKVVRHRQRTVPSLVEETSDVHAAPVGERLDDHETIAAALEAFAALGDQCRKLLRLLCAVPPIDYATIAELIGRPIGSIGPTRRRCLDQLRGHMAAAGGIG